MGFRPREARGAGEQPSRIHAPFADWKAAIELLNGSIMQDRAYKFVYDYRIYPDERSVLKWVTAFQAKYGRHPTASELYRLLDAANSDPRLVQAGMSRPTAQKSAACAESAGLISREIDGR